MREPMDAEESSRMGLPPGRHTLPLEHQGRERPFLLHVPVPPAAGAGSSGGRRPLVLQLHGRGIDPIRFDLWTDFVALADEVGFAVAMPGAVGEIWNDGRYPGRPSAAVDDVRYLTAVIDAALAAVPADPERVYVVGMSNGATMAGRLACERSERIAAIAQVAGTAAASVAATCRPAVPVPILSIHGSADRFAPYAGGRAEGALARLLLRLPAAPSIGVDDWARSWVTVNGADPDPAVELVGADTTVRRWRGASSESDVVFYRVEGGGHTWPGSRAWIPPYFGRRTATFDATRLIWEFLAGHRRTRHGSAGVGQIGTGGVR